MKRSIKLFYNQANNRYSHHRKKSQCIIHFIMLKLIHPKKDSKPWQLSLHLTARFTQPHKLLFNTHNWISLGTGVLRVDQVFSWDFRILILIMLFKIIIWLLFSFESVMIDYNHFNKKRGFYWAIYKILIPLKKIKNFWMENLILYVFD